jgi:hypothetical protein
MSVFKNQFETGLELDSLIILKHFGLTILFILHKQPTLHGIMNVRSI